MTTSYKTNSSNWTSTGWSPVSNIANRGYVGSLAGTTASFNFPSNVTVSFNSLQIGSDYVGAGPFSGYNGYGSVSEGAYTTIVSNRSGAAYEKTSGGYSVQIDSGIYFEILSVGLALSPSFDPNHQIYVGTGSTFRTRPIGTSATNRSSYEKLGPGTLEIYEQSATYNVVYIDSVTISAGTVSLASTAGSTTCLGSSFCSLNTGTLNAVYTRTIATPVSVNAASAISVNAGQTLTLSGAMAASGALSLQGGGTLELTSTTNTYSGTITFNASTTLRLTGVQTYNASYNLVSGTLTMGAANITLACPSLSGTGTINANATSLGSGTSISASGHSGQITGNCSISGGVSTFGSNFTGTISNIASGIITLTNTSSGSITSIGYATVNLTGSFTGGGTTTLAGTGSPAFNPAILNISGANAGLPNRSLAMASNAKITLANGAAAGNTITANTDTSTVTLEVPDATTATYSGTFSTNQTSGNVKVQAKASGTFILSNATAMNSSNAGRTFALNADAGYTGTLKVTGAGFSGSSAATLSRGTLHIAGSTNKSIGTTLTVASGATVAYSPDIPVTLTGNMTLNAGSTFRFGAPA